MWLCGAADPRAPSNNPRRSERCKHIFLIRDVLGRSSGGEVVAGWVLKGARFLPDRYDCGMETEKSKGTKELWDRLQNEPKLGGYHRATGGPEQDDSLVPERRKGGTDRARNEHRG